MIALQDLLDALKARLEALEPGATVYRDNRPDNFLRPSWLVQLGKVEVTELNGTLIGLKQEVILTGFEAVDVYHHAQFETLLQRRAAGMAIFYDGYFPVGDRKPHVTGISSTQGLDYFEILVTLEWSEDLYSDSTLPLIGEVITRIEEKGGQ